MLRKHAISFGSSRWNLRPRELLEGQWSSQYHTFDIVQHTHQHVKLGTPPGCCFSVEPLPGPFVLLAYATELVIHLVVVQHTLQYAACLGEQRCQSLFDTSPLLLVGRIGFGAFGVHTRVLRCSLGENEKGVF